MARLTFRLSCGIWLLMVVVLINSYSGTLISYLTTNKLEPIATTLEEIVGLYEQRNRKCMIAMEKGHPLIHKFDVSLINKYKLYKSSISVGYITYI